MNETNKLNKVKEARELLDSIDTENFSKPNILDLAISKCELAIESKCNNDITNSLDSIKEIKTNDPLFKDIIQSFIIQLYEVQSGNLGQRKLKTMLKKINSYVSLKPNFFGFGVDINAIIDDLVQ